MNAMLEGWSFEVMDENPNFSCKRYATIIMTWCYMVSFTISYLSPLVENNY